MKCGVTTGLQVNKCYQACLPPLGSMFWVCASVVVAFSQKIKDEREKKIMRRSRKKKQGNVQQSMKRTRN